MRRATACRASATSSSACAISTTRTPRTSAARASSSPRRSRAPRRAGRPPIRRRFSVEPLDEAASYLGQAFDREHGGFSGAPKFPHPDTLELLLRRYAALGEPEALELATFTLRKMAEGGIYDQVGGGFARYSVDARVGDPAFREDALRQRAGCCASTPTRGRSRASRSSSVSCAETAAWVMREMQSPEGGYYSSLDADSEGEEGKFYVWTPDEVRALLTPEECAAVAAVFGLDLPPNFENRYWHLVVARPLEAARRRARTTHALKLDSARKLRKAREKRVRPGRDDKVLTSWNALMIGGMAHAARVFGREDWLASARAALDFMRHTMWKDGKLLATAKDGRAHLDAYLDDHAYLLAALLEMLQADFDARDLAWAEEIGEVLMEKFHDAAEGGFFFTSHDHEQLIHRPKPGPDNATPSGNAVAAWALNRLSFLTGETRFADAAAGTIALFWPQLERQPAAFGTLLAALEEQLAPPRTVIVTGPRDQFRPWRELLDSAYLPTTIDALRRRDRRALPPPLAKPASGEVSAWVCEGSTCLAPIARRGNCGKSCNCAESRLPRPATPPREPPMKNTAILASLALAARRGAARSPTRSSRPRTPAPHATPSTRRSSDPRTRRSPRSTAATRAPRPSSSTR